MGITQASLTRLNKHGLLKPCKMLQLGCQNLYNSANYGQVAHPYFSTLGFHVTTWDITGCNDSLIVDLREELPITEQFDLITDYGTTEHIDGNYYQAHKNIHQLTKSGGIIIHENPKAGHWPAHGCNYVTLNFYMRLAELMGYEIIELAEEYAMGNTTDGCNICVVMKKVTDAPFISLNEFKNLEVYEK